jgi:hypothetical protein
MFEIIKFDEVNIFSLFKLKSNLNYVLFLIFFKLKGLMITMM